MPPPRALTQARIKELKALRDKRRRLEAGLYVVEGFHVVEEALLAAAPVVEVLVGEGAAKSHVGERILEAARASKIPVTEIPRRVLEQLADVETPQGVMAVVKSPDPAKPL